MVKKSMGNFFFLLALLLKNIAFEAKKDYYPNKEAQLKEVLRKEDVPTKFWYLLEDQGEYPIWFGRTTERHYIFSSLLTSLFLLTFVALYVHSQKKEEKRIWGLLTLLSLFLLLYNLLSIPNFSRAAYLITNRRVIIKRGGFFSSGIDFLFLKNISDIQIKQGFFDHYFFSTGTISFFTGDYEDVAVYKDGQRETKTTKKKDKEGKMCIVEEEEVQHAPVFSHYEKVAVREKIASIPQPYRLYRLLQRLTKK